MLLKNPKNKLVEFYYDSKPYQLEPGEVRDFPKHIVKHATITTNTGLIEIEETKKIESLPWKQLVSKSSELGIFKSGMSREVLIKALEEHEHETN